MERRCHSDHVNDAKDAEKGASTSVSASTSASVSASASRGQGQASADAKPAHRTLAAVDIIGRIASVLSVIMYVSYITQIANNLDGHPGSPWQPLAAFFNCTMWTIYGVLKPKKDWPIIVANIPGIFLGATAFLTALIH